MLYEYLGAQAAQTRFGQHLGGLCCLNCLTGLVGLTGLGGLCNLAGLVGMGCLAGLVDLAGLAGSGGLAGLTAIELDGLTAPAKKPSWQINKHTSSLKVP